MRLITTYLLLLATGCDEMAIRSNQYVPPRMPTGFASHTLSVTSHLYTYATGLTISGGTADVSVRVYKPDGVPAHQPLPMMVAINTGSFSTSSAESGETLAAFFTSCGMLFALVETRVHPDLPTEPDSASRGASTNLGRTIDALTFDVKRAIVYLRSNPDRDNWTVEPNWVFAGGESSGFMLSMFSTIRDYPSTYYIAGLIGVIGAFGLDNGLLGMDATDEIRTELGFTEGDLTAALPVCHFSISDDTTINTAPNDWNGDLNTVITGFGAPSIIHLDGSSTGHFGLDSWVEPGALTNASTVEEAIYNFVVSVLPDVPTIGGSNHVP